MTTTKDLDAMDAWSFADQDENACTYDVRIVTDPHDTIIRIQNEGNVEPILELSAAGARRLSDLLENVADAADKIQAAQR